MVHLLVKSFSESLGIIESSVHPHKSWSTLTPPTNLNEDKVSSFACSSHLVSIPGDLGHVRIPGLVDFQATDGITNSTLQSNDMDTNDTATSTNFFWENVDWPNRI